MLQCGKQFRRRYVGFRTADRGVQRIGVILGVASTTELVTEMAGRLQGPRWERELRAAGLAESARGLERGAVRAIARLAKAAGV